MAQLVTSSPSDVTRLDFFFYASHGSGELEKKQNSAAGFEQKFERVAEAVTTEVQKVDTAQMARPVQKGGGGCEVQESPTMD